MSQAADHYAHTKTYEIKCHLKQLGLKVSGSRNECLQRLQEVLE